MRRFIDEELWRWKDGIRRKPLILRGARQVGKTWSLKEFGKTLLFFDEIQACPRAITALRYFFIGGMPAAIKTYAESGSLRDAFEVQGEIVESYRMDFAKYTPQVDRNCLDSVFTSLAQRIGQSEKRRHRKPEKPASVHGRLPGVR